MKRLQNILTMTLALMMAGTLGTWAQTNGHLACNGATLHYSFSGGNVTAESDAHPGMQRTYNCEVRPGTTIYFECKGNGRTNKNGGPQKCSFKIEGTTSKTRLSEGQQLVNKKVQDEHVKYSYTIPNNAGLVRIDATYDSGTRIPCSVFIYFHVVGEPVPQPNSYPEVDFSACNCNTYKGTEEELSPMYRDCGVRFNDITGDVSVRPCDEDDDAFESAEFDTILHYCDLIKTEKDSEAVLSLTDKTSFTIKEKTRVLLPPYEGEVSNIKMIAGVIWINMKRMIFNGGEMRLDGTQAVAGIRGTIVTMEETGSETRFWLLTGKVDVTSKKTGKKVSLKAGQMTTTGKDGKIVVKKFNIEQGAKKFGIPMSEIRNHYSTTGTGTTATANRYEVERAVVKYRVTQNGQTGEQTKTFDNFGQLERRHLKLSNQQTTQITCNNTTYTLDPKTKTAKEQTDAETNFLNFSTPKMKKLNLQKKGTATVLGRECTVYANNDSRYYVWKGIVLKRLVKTKNGTVTTEAVSIEQPTTVDPNLFKLPAGYRKTN